jgi:hypothetical protein
VRELALLRRPPVAGRRFCEPHQVILDPREAEHLRAKVEWEAATGCDGFACPARAYGEAGQAAGQAG